MNEVELKLGFPASMRRALERHPALREARVGRGTRRELYSVYYDTADERLRLGAAALRIRRDGARWIQTWKSAGTAIGGLHTRDEVEWTVPREALVAEHIADRLASLDPPIAFARLRPAFVTRFVRYAFDVRLPGEGLAEVAIDAGTIEARGRTEPISEIEIELKAGDPAGLFDLAIRLAEDVPFAATVASKAERGYALGRRTVLAPARASRIVLDRDTTVDAVRRIQSACIAQMQANEPGVLRRDDPEFLHQFRVGVRRLKASLAVLRPLVPPEPMEALADDLRWLGESIGPARDWDVWVTSTLPALRAAFVGHAGLAAIERASAAERRRATRTAREALASARYARLLLRAAQASLAARLPEDGSVPALAHDYAATVLDRRWRRLRKRDPVDASPADRHRTRIAAKKLRYAVEFFGMAFGKRDGKRARRFARCLARLQDTLGAMNDAATAEKLLAQLAASARPPDAETLALVRGWIAGFGAGGVEGAAAAWRELRAADRFW